MPVLCVPRLYDVRRHEPGPARSPVARSARMHRHALRQAGGASPPGDHPAPALRAGRHTGPCARARRLTACLRTRALRHPDTPPASSIGASPRRWSTPPGKRRETLRATRHERSLIAITSSAPAAQITIYPTTVAARMAPHLHCPPSRDRTVSIGHHGTNFMNFISSVVNVLSDNAQMHIVVAANR